MKILLTGSQGQLGRALRASLPQMLQNRSVELIATSRNGGDGLAALDLADADACRAAVLECKPDWVINAGAYTAVDRAETEPELAHAVNALAPRAFAEALAQTGGCLLQVSTDFVFNGRQGHPYGTDQPRDPLGVYGTTKAAGEQAIAELLGLERGGKAALLRTSWVYGPVGNNFLLTMLRLHRQKVEAAEPLRVVADQVGCPTATAGLAGACWRLVERQLGGVMHWSDAGAASWYDFAVAIGELAEAAGQLERAATISPISTADYPTPAQRPAYSLLDCTSSRELLGLRTKHWYQALREVIADVGT
ncbi:dTDP-4-dehydrorhamnose reductase [Synechococcus sp. UW179B]|uniref:dTDP-4-dehydrorhamnose reductase n=1 Tax=Synechococcus sp. UW179B TaxID=2575516 RepID=UPI000E0EC44F|nr:dTDP-4-dehydrorhamnose reductase [Synechococcus sp. UW179B]